MENNREICHKKYCCSDIQRVPCEHYGKNVCSYCDENVRTHYHECLYCKLEGKMGAEREWDSYEEALTQALEIVDGGYKDGLIGYDKYSWYGLYQEGYIRGQYEKNMGN